MWESKNYTNVKKNFANHTPERWPACAPLGVHAELLTWVEAPLHLVPPGQTASSNCPETPQQPSLSQWIRCRPRVSASPAQTQRTPLGQVGRGKIRETPIQSVDVGGPAGPRHRAVVRLGRPGPWWRCDAGTRSCRQGGASGRRREARGGAERGLEEEHSGLGENSGVVWLGKGPDLGGGGGAAASAPACPRTLARLRALLEGPRLPPQPERWCSATPAVRLRDVGTRVTQAAHIPSC